MAGFYSQRGGLGQVKKPRPSFLLLLREGAPRYD